MRSLRTRNKSCAIEQKLRCESVQRILHILAHFCSLCRWKKIFFGEGLAKMKELFTIDKKNYDKNGTVGTRPSVRGIVIEDGKIAMMHSLKYNYYKLPGGGMENGESYEDTLVREVQEESGLVVKRESIRELGYVRRIEKGRFEEIFIQDNYYYLCEVEEKRVKQCLDDYEEEERFTLEFVTPKHAIGVNENANHGEKEEIHTFSGMLDRENSVLKLLEKEILHV